MDYVVGGIAALISGNVTPSRPKHLRRPLTPTKHQPSPNVTPKSEFVEDRSIFLSPTMQKKKAIVKKSPKRIFQNPELEVTDDGDKLNSSSPKVEKVKKHLKGDLESDPVAASKVLSPKSPKRSNDMLDKTLSPNKINKTDEVKTRDINIKNKSKKKKDKNKNTKNEIIEPVEEINNAVVKKKKKGKNKIHSELEKYDDNTKIESDEEVNDSAQKKKKKVKQNKKDNTEVVDTSNCDVVKLKKKKKKKSKEDNESKTNVVQNEDKENESDENYVNPNAITNKDTDSEHESDDEMASDNETSNKKAFETAPVESSDEDDDKTENQTTEQEKTQKETPAVSQDEVKRTLFVGNVPLSKKTKKELKKIFSEYGKIETVRIRTVPVKDARMTPKMAVIKNELHPDRTTVNVYIKYEDAVSVDRALSANNTVLNDHHLRVSRSDSTGATHDPKCSVFVGNIPFALEDEGLRAKFVSCGEIESVRIVRDKKTNAGKGFGYVNFASKDGVELALALTEEDLTIKNRILRIKRCTQGSEKKAGKGKKPGFGNNQGNRQGFAGRSSQGNRQGFGDRSNQGGRQGFGDRSNQGNRQGFGDRSNQGNRKGFGDRNRQGFGERNNQGNRQRFGDRNNQGNRQGFRDGNQMKQNFSRPGQSSETDGAYRRLMNKRKNAEGSDGPAQKRPRDAPPTKDKARKEFVGMTAEKKKKSKFCKGQKKKKALSEILTKN